MSMLEYIENTFKPEFIPTWCNVFLGGLNIYLLSKRAKKDQLKNGVRVTCRRDMCPGYTEKLYLNISNIGDKKLTIEHVRIESFKNWWEQIHNARYDHYKEIEISPKLLDVGESFQIILEEDVTSSIRRRRNFLQVNINTFSDPFRVLIPKRMFPSLRYSWSRVN